MPQTFTMSVGETKTLAFVPKDATGAPGAFVPGGGGWLGDNPSVATVSSTGDLSATIVAVAPGTVNVTETLQSETDEVPGANVSKSCIINVTGGPVADGTFSLT